MKKAPLFLLFLLIVACTAQPQPIQDVSTIVNPTLTAIALQQGNPPASPPPASPVTETPEPDTPAAPASPTPPTSVSTSSTDVSFLGTNFTIPAGLATGSQNDVVPQSNDPDVPFQVYPAYLKFVLQGYPLQGTAFEPQVLVFPAKEFEQMSEGAKAIINDLQNILMAQRVSPAEPLPFLPMLNAGQIFHAQEKFLSFQNGSGIRYITQFDQAPLPINNTEIFYTFQGLTGDNNYYVSIIMPINLSFLPANNSVPSITPPDGILFDTENYPSYLIAITDRLNHVDNPFNPSLESLDTLVQSLLTVGQK